MTTAGTRRIRARGGAVRWTRAAAIALFAVLVVLVHHETVAVASAPAHTAAMSGMPGMGHTSAMTVSKDAMDHDTAVRAVTPVGGDIGPCSGAAMQHCSAAGVDTVKIAPPAELHVGRDTNRSDTSAGRAVPGTVSRAPPDLSVLSRLLL
ncbi:hypothetical protein [Streptomyces milbemycinicus]|uniref:Uncharacterized protein n=1 Tax=Streptomyces milbemycinicus TaxID=476552 RepID=A0ABW8LNR2_9ACTN